jgi:hypothetical protein
MSDILGGIAQMGISRRTFVGLASAGAVVPFSQWWSQNASAQVEQPFKRASAHSPAGKRALASYRKAVAEMERLSRADPKNPIGWMFQYKIHQFPDDWDTLRNDPTRLAAAKRAELDRIFGAGTPERALAARILGTCHASSTAGGDEFWPWHRMYVFFFERICRKLSQDPTFALPCPIGTTTIRQRERFPRSSAVLSASRRTRSGTSGDSHSTPVSRSLPTG